MLRDQVREWLFASVIFTGVGIAASWLPHQEFSWNSVMLGVMSVWLVVIFTIASFRLMREGRVKHLHQVMLFHRRPMTAEQLVLAGGASSDTVHERLFHLQKRGMVATKISILNGEETEYYFLTTTGAAQSAGTDPSTIQPPSSPNNWRERLRQKEGMGGN